MLIAPDNIGELNERFLSAVRNSTIVADSLAYGGSVGFNEFHSTKLAVVALVERNAELMKRITQIAMERTPAAGVNDDAS